MSCSWADKMLLITISITKQKHFRVLKSVLIILDRSKNWNILSQFFNKYLLFVQIESVSIPLDLKYFHKLVNVHFEPLKSEWKKFIVVSWDLHLWFLRVGIVDKVSTFFIDAEICQMDEVVANYIWIICVFLCSKPENSKINWQYLAMC